LPAFLAPKQFLYTAELDQLNNAVHLNIQQGDWRQMFSQALLNSLPHVIGGFTEIEDETSESWESLDPNEVAHMEVPNQSSYLSSLFTFWQR
jgi:hypothetical protein